ncbi:alpha-1,4-glucan--maltose-1-phosphate maltosyltransferase [Herbaspirillum sp. HC18]|nr:alpha-1,4-glucan--maltose-1-phosphate maltosyltransferase [Herbaspirillum sp. HC18]
MQTTKPFLPRIQTLAMEPAAPDLEKRLERCAALGFDHILVRQGPEETMRMLVRECTIRRLRVLVDLDLRALGADPFLTECYPDWFRSPGPYDDLPDPRRIARREPARALRYDREGIAGEVAAHLARRVLLLAASGVAGVRCIGVCDAPAALWKTLIGEVKASSAATRFLAWTPGCTQAQIDAIADCGFDATFSSGAWWDYKSRWLAEEQGWLARVAPPIAFPDSPDEPVIGRLTGNEEATVRRQIYLRALRLAAVIGNGILVPMGFEYGVPASVALSEWDTLGANAPFDLSEDIVKVNAFIASKGAAWHAKPFRILSGADAPIAVLLREALTEAVLAVANADATHPCDVEESRLLERAGGFIRCGKLLPEGEAVSVVELAEAELQVFEARPLAPVLAAPARGKQGAVVAARMPRIAIEAVSPAADAGRFPVKRTVGECVSIEADVFTDGHDKIAVAVLWRTADETEWREIRMHPLENDRWAASLPLTRLGRYLFAIEAWRDVFSTYRDELEKKTGAGLNVSVELEEGRLMVEAALQHAQENDLGDTAATLKTLVKNLKGVRDKAKAAARDAERVAALLSEPMLEAMRAADARPFAVRSEPVMRIDVERRAARFSSWYELFPRSQSGDPDRHGTFADVEKRLPTIQAMGFDTLYFTPIHPIGRKHRKGRNNSLTPGHDDPGSPYAIGSEEGGHDTLHPQLGTLEDFRHLRIEAARHGLELALDFAIQCSPDHPWLKAHPEWFAWRPDGTIRYAENPPKKYQDIVNVDFYADGAVPDLWIGLRDVVLFWVKEGIRIFRVDNPHTKPLPFWEWLIADIRGRFPDTIFLSEAFTRPKMMYRLAKIGYSQSYTYFTWRHTKQEFIDYMTELTTTPVREYFRPHFFVNTPDINPVFLQRSGRPGFLIRAALATLLSGLWGMYSGFELCEGTPVPGKEEYLDSEKYEIRAWDWQRPGNIIQEITQLNRIRRENPALQTHLNVRFLGASSDNILFFMKATAPAGSCERFGDNVILAAINLDPFAAHEATLELPLWEFGLPDDGVLEVVDLVNGAHLAWRGRTQHLRLDPFVFPYAVWRVRHK